ncbi:hypothetical protein BD779DRAFT_1727678 [Infundibulicybe gibba]|nr:hypothetical protein BD779DRAFT_1727678 [Infundibulicybe gibba]
MTGFSSLPLGAEDAEHGDDRTRQWKGTSRVLGPGWVHLPTLTIGLLGVQIFWSVEMSYASPYLLSLGLSKSKMAIVFVAGPLSGLIMQPLVGVLADNSTSRWGRRRPYMLIGTILCICAMLLLGFTRPFASIFTGADNDANDILTIWLAVLAIYLIDFSINAVQAVDRALLVDTLPQSSQASGNAWAACMLGIGSVVGFFFANVDLRHALPFLGKSQLQVLAVLVSFVLFAGQVLQPFASKRNAWLGWFPVLFYSTIYVGDFHKRASPNPPSPELDAEATRLGSRALFYSSLIALFANLALPLFVSEASRKGKGHRQAGDAWWERFVVPDGLKVHMASLWAVSHLVFAGCMFATLFTKTVFGSTFLISITGFSWAVTQWAPFSLLAEAILTDTSADDTGFIQLSDTRTTRRHSGEEGERDVFLVRDDDDDNDDESDDGAVVVNGDNHVDQMAEERRRVLGNLNAQISRVNISVNEDELSQGGGSRGKGLSAKSGIILGIHNVFIVIPQFLVTGLAAVIFAIFDPEKSVLHGSHPGNTAAAPHNGTILSVVVSQNITTPLRALIPRDEAVSDAKENPSGSIVYIFRIGGVAAMIAFVLCWRLARELRHR